jgi:regulator of nucleoside diphosphate kinase
VRQKEKKNMSTEIHRASYKRAELPPIILREEDQERLRNLADAVSEKFPRIADFLAREVERASILDARKALPGLVIMGSDVTFRDDTTGKTRRVTLVYPDEADIDAGKISVLTPIGAALIGLSVSQSIEWQTQTGDWRSLTVLEVRQPQG